MLADHLLFFLAPVLNLLLYLRLQLGHQRRTVGLTKIFIKETASLYLLQSCLKLVTCFQVIRLCLVTLLLQKLDLTFHQCLVPFRVVLLLKILPLHI
jgi:hypothetical protein